MIDNANALDDLEQHYSSLCRLPNCHILLTSRVNNFEAATNLSVGTLSKDTALELFTRYYPTHNTAENDLLFGVFEQVGFNTLVIELLAKNLNALNTLQERYSLSQLLEDIDKKGLTQLSQSKPVKPDWRDTPKAKPEDIITAMYQLADLPDAEQQLIVIFSVLPAEPIPFEHLAILLQNIEDIDDVLQSLNQQGWIEFNPTDKSFKCSPVVQQVVRGQSETGPGWLLSRFGLSACLFT